MENWYINAEEIASFLSRQTPAYNETELRKMFYDHLDMERQQMEAYLDGDYETDIEIYLRSQREYDRARRFSYKWTSCAVNRNKHIITSDFKCYNHKL